MRQLRDRLAGLLADVRRLAAAAGDARPRCDCCGQPAAAVLNGLCCDCHRNGLQKRGNG